MMTRLTPVCVLTLCGWIASSRADDWPRWRGPQRTGISQETGLLKKWPKSGPKMLWERKDIGGGYSTPAIVGDRIYLMANREGKEYVVALAVKDGSQDWATAIGKVGRNEGPQYPGTRSTPTVEGDRIYVLGSDGDLACLEKDKGRVLWSKNLKKAIARPVSSVGWSDGTGCVPRLQYCTRRERQARFRSKVRGPGRVFPEHDGCCCPWDKEPRRPWHADKRKALQREMLRGEIEAALAGRPSKEKIRFLGQRLLDLAA